MRILILCLVYMVLTAGCRTPLRDELVPHSKNESAIQFNYKDLALSLSRSKPGLLNIDITLNDTMCFYIRSSDLMKTLFVFDDSLLIRVISYDVLNNKVADCSIKNNKPYTGTLWSVVYGLRGIKFSYLITYQDGSLISDVPYKQQELSDLLDAFAAYSTEYDKK